MIKKVFSAGVVLMALSIILGSTPALAVDDSTLPGNNARTQTTNCIGSPDMNCGEPVTTSDEIAEPIDDVITDCIDVAGGANPETDCVSIVEKPTECIDDELGANKCDAPDEEPECNTENSDDCDVADPEDEEAGEPATWPMYVSLGALGLAVVTFIVLNLFGGKKK